MPGKINGINYKQNTFQWFIDKKKLVLRLSGK